MCKSCLFLCVCLCLCVCICNNALLLFFSQCFQFLWLEDSMILSTLLLPTLFLLASAAGFNGLFYWQLVVHIYLALVIFPGPPNSRRRCLSRAYASAQFWQQKEKRRKNQAKRTRKIHSPNLQSLPSDARSPMPASRLSATKLRLPIPDSQLPIPKPIPIPAPTRDLRLLRGCCAILFSSN